MESVAKAAPAATPNSKKYAVLERIATQLSGLYDSFVLGSCFDDNKTPIVHASKGFLELTEFSEEEILGKEVSCDFLLGADTHPSHMRRVPAAIKHRTKTKLSLILYRKSVAAFLARVEIQPIKDESGQVVLMAVAISLLSDLNDPSTQFLVPHSPQGLISRKFRQFTGRSPRRNEQQGELSKSDAERGANRNLEQSTANDWCGGWVIDCNHSAKICWDWLLMVATIYAGVTAPFNAVFYRSAEWESVFGDTVVGLTFVIDIILNFRTSYYDNFGQPVRDPARITKNYMMGWFWIDFIAAFPFDLLLLFSSDMDQAVILLKCMRLLRLTKIWVTLELYSEYSSVILAINMVLYILLAHWFACVWYYIAKYEWTYGEKQWNVGWLYKLMRALTGDGSANKPPSVPIDPHDLQMYWTAMYFSLTMLTTVGFGNEAPNSVGEKIAVCVALPVFALMHAVVFGQVTAIIQRMYARRFAFDIQQKELKDFYRIYSVPKPLKRKMQEFFQTQWTVHRGIHHEKVIRDFPEDLKADVLEHMYADFLGLPILSDAPRDFVKLLALQIKHTFINPSEFLIRAGDVPRCYYFVCAGSLEVAHPDGEVSALVGKDELIGGDLIQSNAKCGMDVKAATYCDLHTVKVDSLIWCLSLYPEFAVTFSDRLDHQLAVNLSSRTMQGAEKIPSPLWRETFGSTGVLTRRQSVFMQEPPESLEAFPFMRKMSMPFGARTQAIDIENTLSAMQRNLDAMAENLRRFGGDVNILKNDLRSVYKI